MATIAHVTAKFMECNICAEVCRRPSTLSCQHTFCQGCLIGYIRTQTDAVKTRCIPCPTCRQHSHLPHLEESTEAEHGSVCKKVSETTLVTHWCSDCEVSVCDGCLNLHRQMAKAVHHNVIEVTNATNLSKLTRIYTCEEHNNDIRLICRNCRKYLCSVGCTGDHRSCQDVTTLQPMLPEVTQELHNRQMKLTGDTCDESKNVADKTKIKIRLARTSEIESEVKEVTKSIVDLVHQKEDKLIKKLNDIIEQQTGQLQARVKSEEMEIQTDQQQAQLISQIHKKDDETQLDEAYVSGLGAVGDVTETQQSGASISFIYNLEKLKEEIEKLDVSIVDDVIDITASPVLQEVIDTNTDDIDQCNVTDVVRMKIEDMQVTVVADMNNTVKSIYSQNGERLSSQLHVKTCPWSLSVLSQNKVVVSVPRSNKILTVGVNPDLELLSSLTTKKQYSGLAVLDQSTLVASCLSPPSVDVLGMMGHVIRSISAHQQLFRNPQHIHVTSHGNILVTDYTAYSLVCLNQTGQVEFTYSGIEVLYSPRGVTSTSAGDILVTDSGTNRVVHFSKSGQFIRDILTSEDGLEYPRGLCVDGDKLCVATRHGGVHVFRFT